MGGRVVRLLAFAAIAGLVALVLTGVTPSVWAQEHCVYCGNILEGCVVYCDPYAQPADAGGGSGNSDSGSPGDPYPPPADPFERCNATGYCTSSEGTAAPAPFVVSDDPVAWCDQNTAVCQTVRHRRNETERQLTAPDQADPEKVRIAVEQGAKQSPSTSGKPQAKPPDGVPANEGQRPTAGDPVSLASGSLSLRVVDLTLPGPVRPLEFRRTYDSRHDGRSPLGSNWTHNFDVFLRPLTRHSAPGWAPADCKTDEPSNRCLALHDGGSERLYVRVRGRSYFVTLTGDATTLHELPDGWVLLMPDGHRLRFDRRGLLVEDRDRFGNGFTIDYEPTGLGTVYDRYCGRWGHYIANQDPRLCAALHFVFEAGPREKWDTWGPVPNDDLKTVFCPGGQEFLTGPEGLGLQYIPVPVSGGIRWELVIAPDEWACAVRGWDRRSGRVPFPAQTHQKVHAVEPGLTYIRVALPDERRFEEIYQAAEAFFGEDLPPEFPRAMSRLSFTERQQLLQALAELERLLDRGEINLRPLLRESSVYHTPGNPYGHRRFRPIRVTDDTGRSLLFAYYGGEDQPRWTGLLKRVEGPEGTGAVVEFKFGEPPHHPHRLNELFLTRVVRTPAAAPFPRDVLCLECASGTLGPQGVDYAYAWPATEPPDLAAGTTYAPHLYGFWHALADFFVPGEPGVQENNRLASVEALRYVETQADNLVRVTRFSIEGSPTGPVEANRTIELETRYEPGPWHVTRDRVIAQRYGGQETGLVDWAQGWRTGLPEWAFGYVDARPQEPLDGGRPALPAEILARYPLESMGALVRESLQEFFASASPGSYLRITPPIAFFYFEPTASDAASSRLRRTPLQCADLAAAELWDFRPDARSGDPGAFAELRRRATANANRLCRWASVRSPEGVRRHYGFNYRGQVLVHAVYEPVEGRFIFSEHRYDADGQVLEVREPTGSDRTRPWSPADGYLRLEYAGAPDSDAESWRGRLNLVRRTHYPPSAPVAGYVAPTGDIATYAQATRFEYEPAFNQLREVLTGALDRYGDFRATYRVRYEFDGGCPVGPWERACRLSPELCALRLDLLRQLDDVLIEVRKRCRTRACLLGDVIEDLERAAAITAQFAAGEAHRHAQVAVELGRDLLDLEQTGQIAREGRRPLSARRLRHRAAGRRDLASRDPWPGQPTVTRLLAALDAWRASFEKLADLPGLVGVGWPRNTCGRPRPDRVIFEHPDAPETRRVVEYRWAPHGRPVEIAQRGGRTVSIAYHDTSYDDARVRSTAGSEAMLTPDQYCANPPVGRYCRGAPMGTPQDPLRRPDGRGFPAEITQTRHDADYGPVVPVGTCSDLAAPYRGLLSACPTGVDAALNELGLPDEIIAPMRASTAVASSTVRLRHAVTGHPWLIDADGHRTRLHLDVDGRLLRQYSADGTMSVAWRDALGRPRELRLMTRQGDLLARTVLRYNRQGQPTARCEELEVGGCGPFANEGRLDYIPFAPNTNPRFQLRLYQYTDDGLLRKRADPGSPEEGGFPEQPNLLEEWYVYNARGQLVLETALDPRAPGQGRSRRYTYDVAGQLVKREGGHSGVTVAETFAYDGFRRLERQVDRRGLECAYRYTSRSELSRVRCHRIGGDGRSEPAWEMRRAYDDHGHVAFEELNGVQTRRLTWGPWGRSLRLEATGLGVTQAVYDPSGRPIWSRDAEGNDRVWTVEPEERRLAEATIHRGDASLTETEITDLDAAGLPVQRRRVVRAGPGPATVQTELWERDPAGRLERTVDFGGREQRFVRNLAGWPVLVRFGAIAEAPGLAAETSELYYDVRGRLRRLVDPTGQNTFFAHNGFDQPTVVAYPGDRVYGFFYDPLGRVERFRRPGGSESEFRYDEHGDLEAEWVNQQRRRTFRFDDLGRLESTSDTNAPLTAFGMLRPLVVERLTYDGLSRIAGYELKTGLAPAQLVKIDRTATAGGWRRTVTTPRGAAWTYDFDRIGRLAGLTSPEGHPTKFGWRGDLPLGRTQSWDSGAAALDERAEHDLLGFRSAWRYGLGSQTLLDIGAHRDALGRIVSLVERIDGNAGGPVHWAGYRYDPFRRLVESWDFRGADGALGSLPPAGQLFSAATLDATVAAVQPQAAWKHERDQVGALGALADGNSSVVRWQHIGPRAPGQRLISVTIDDVAIAVTHDGLGRVSTAGPWRYTFDESDRLVAVERDGALVEAYAYTALGRLAGVYAKDGLETALAYDGTQLVAAHDLQGKPRWEVTWGPTASELIEWRDLSLGRRYLPLQDHRRSVRLAWDTAAAELTDRAEYDEYGRLEVLAPDQTLRCVEKSSEVCAPPINLPFAFLGAWRSPRTGLLHLGARWYSAALGQFLSTDPADYVDGFNLYGFAAQDPINRWDPDGRESKDLTDDGGEREVFQFEGRYYLDILRGPGVKDRFQIEFDPATGDPILHPFPAPRAGSPCFDDPAQCTCRDDFGAGGFCTGRVEPSFFPWEPLQLGRALVELPRLLSALGRGAGALADKGRGLYQSVRGAGRPPTTPPGPPQTAIKQADEAVDAARAPAGSALPRIQVPDLKGKTPDELVKELDQQVKAIQGADARSRFLQAGYEQAKRRMKELFKDKANFEFHEVELQGGWRMFYGATGNARFVGPDGRLYKPAKAYDAWQEGFKAKLQSGEIQVDFKALIPLD